MGVIHTLFRTSHQELRETSNITVEDSGMHHANMMRNIIAGPHEALQKNQVQTETPTVVQASVDHVDNVVKSTQLQLSTQLQQMKAMMQAI